MISLHKYSLLCLTETARYRALALRHPEPVYKHLAKAWLKRARLANKAINRAVSP